MVPVRFVSETLGAEVNWDGNAKRVSICTPPESNPGDSTLPDPQKAGTNILSSTTVTVEQAQAWARSRGATQTFINLAPLYWRLAPERGVNPAGAYAQAAKETGFGRFGGVLDESFRNPCGMKTTQGGDNYDPDAHQRFSSWEEGVTAHLDHLALYAGATGYPKEDTPDPRHFAVIKGRAATFEDLGGKWAPSPDYGISIVRDYLATLLAYKSVNGEQEAVLNSQ
ncbi:MAG: glucosaminidase domain-containing protein [Peptococcaceae bacterium]|nr:glucosaminidase domain-containing protein [Peptococcaceae bacterium]